MSTRKQCNEEINELIGQVLIKRIRRIINDPSSYDDEVIGLAMRWLEYNELPIQD